MDIYFDKNYGKLYEEIEGGVQQVWQLQCKYGTVCHQFIKRPLEGGWCDLITPYGYGGPVITQLYAGAKKEQLIEEFKTGFAAYCKDNRVVSEFVRFHPLLGNGVDFCDIYHSEKVRHTVGTNLKEYIDPVKEEFSKGCQKRIRQALNKGVSYTITENPSSLDRFMDIYYATMDRNAAGEFYYFDKTYFDRMLRYFGENLLLIEAGYEGEVIAAGIFFLYADMVHVHLTGTRTEYLHLSPAYILRFAATRWAKEHGYCWIHHGGGRSNSEEDSLYQFKKQFGNNTTFDFYIGKKIWNEDAYWELCSKNGVTDTEFFPAYRVKKG